MKYIRVAAESIPVTSAGRLIPSQSSVSSLRK
jgi:hypothetical protein